MALQEAERRSPSLSPRSSTVLIIDDEPGYVTVLSAALEARGYGVVVARDGQEALVAAVEHQPDVTILDLGLPDVDGIEVCRQLRQIVRTPIVVVSADGAEDRKVDALDAGADDYVTKPFSTPELMARLRVALRHREQLNPTSDDAVLVVGDVQLDPSAHIVSVGGAIVTFTPKEFALLAVLMRNTGGLVPNSTLLHEVWRGEGTINTLRIHVGQVRRKLGSGSERPAIENVAVLGYRLVSPS
jgi:two-component system KDP operon response regulator KdpE